MFARGSYQVASLEEGNRLERHQSLRSCILALLIFFFLCVILLLTTFPFKGSKLRGDGYYEHQDKFSAQTFGEANKDIESSTENVDVITEQQEMRNRTFFERYSNNATSSDLEFESSTDMETSTVSVDAGFTVSSTEEYSTLYESAQTTDNYDNETSTHVTESFSQSLAEEDSTTDNSISSSSEIGTTSPLDAITDSFSYEANSERVNIITESYNDTIAAIGAGEVLMTSAIINDSHVRATTPASINEEASEEICVSGECKQIASKMLFYMNHSSDPCEDFYEYACGSFETNPQTIERDLENVAYERISREMEKRNREGVTSTFSQYYNSCVEFEKKSFRERIELVKLELDRIGKFYTTANWHENEETVTDLLAKLLLHHSPLLFDVAPDLSEQSPESYTLKIGPVANKNLLDTGSGDDGCSTNEIARNQEFVDLRELYNEYRTCKNDTKKYISSIEEALTQLGVFGELRSSYNISQYIKTTVINIDLEIIQKYYGAFPSNSEIREAYLIKNYTYVRVKNLGGDTKLLNWTQLIAALTGVHMIPEGQLQVYFQDKLNQGLKILDEFARRDPMQLHNALLGLYARNLYQSFVLKTRRNAKDHCIRVAASLMIPEASSLYISSFSEDERSLMNRTTHQVFESLKETLKIRVAEETWTTESGRHALKNKVDALKLAVPNISYLIDETSTFKNYTADKFHLSDNYVENSISLMHRYRTLVYAELFTNPRDPEQIWTHYATPFQSKALAIYGLNLVVVPFGVVDWSSIVNDDTLEYLNLATLGTVIAHQIAHHFDANGIYYWNETRDSNSSLSEHELPNPSFEEYISCQKNVHFQPSMELTIPSTGQTVSYKITQLTLNERLSEAVGLRLAYDTLDRVRSSKEALLPWLGRTPATIGIDHLFYLAYAQMHCTKLPLTSSYVSLFENEQLPSRIRIFLTGLSNQRLGETWSCPAGSGMAPSNTCSVFPYLQSQDFITIYSE